MLLLLTLTAPLSRLLRCIKKYCTNKPRKNTYAAGVLKAVDPPSIWNARLSKSPSASTPGWVSETASLPETVLDDHDPSIATGQREAAWLPNNAQMSGAAKKKSITLNVYDEGGLDFLRDDKGGHTNRGYGLDWNGWHKLATVQRMLQIEWQCTKPSIIPQHHLARQLHIQVPVIFEVPALVCSSLISALQGTVHGTLHNYRELPTSCCL